MLGVEKKYLESENGTNTVQIMDEQLLEQYSYGPPTNERAFWAQRKFCPLDIYYDDVTVGKKWQQLISHGSAKDHRNSVVPDPASSVSLVVSFFLSDCKQNIRLHLIFFYNQNND